MPTKPQDRLILKETDRLRYWFIPRKNPRPAPIPGILDAPYVCLRINQEWLSHILGMITVLLEPDAWDGDVYRAQQEVEKFLSQIKDPCAESSLMQFRQTECVLEVSTDGVIWTPVFDSSVCVIPGDDGTDGREIELRAIATSDPLCQMQQWRYVGESAADWRDLGLVCNGQDGEDGECEDCGPINKPPEIDPEAPDANENYCGIAEVIVERLNSYHDDIIAGVGANQATIDIVTNLIAASVIGDLIIDNIISLIASGDALYWASAQAVLTTQVLDDVTCALYCVIKANQGFNVSLKPRWKEEYLTGPYNRPVDVLYVERFIDLFDSYDANHWNGWAATADPSNDCQLCDCTICEEVAKHWQFGGEIGYQLTAGYGSQAGPPGDGGYIESTTASPTGQFPGDYPASPDSPFITGGTNRNVIVRLKVQALVDKIEVQVRGRRADSPAAAAMSVFLYCYDAQGEYLGRFGGTATTAPDVLTTYTINPNPVCVEYALIAIGYGSSGGSNPYIQLHDVKTFPTDTP